VGATPWCRYDAAARVLTLLIHAQPGARSSAIVGEHGGALKIRIQAPAVDNKANAALVAFLADVLGVPGSSVTVRRGARGRLKSVDVRGVGPEAMAKLDVSAAG
jgi:uncharacterized protein (TIGR00251 family)